ncbi:MAG TPA: phosphomannomutase/phosphoglucomutase [Candidatus Methanoperedens sp.]|nr:phosphomannomutase/phosphoglucomutase [Candidatus Methanoperedens sp.]
MINPQIFREYDVRGTVGRDLNPELVELLGRGVGTLLRRAGGRRAVLARDNRLSSPAYRDALAAGLVAAGVDVVDLGLVPTPLLYFGLHHLPCDGGVMITGSHNPPEFNGFKIAIGKSTIWGPRIQELRGVIERHDFESGEGALTRADIAGPYREMILGKIRLARPLRVAVDAGSGTGGIVAPRLLRELGCEVTELWCEPDGTYPGHFPDPTVPANLADLIRTVRERGLDCGIGYDGDADRIGVVDEQGNILWGDQLLMIYAREILAQGPASVVFEVKCSQNLARDVERHGGRPVMWKTGHSLIKEKMKTEHAAIAGEMSGHIFFADDYFGFDDAVYASLRLLRILAASGKPLSALLADVPKTFSTPEIRVDCPDERKFEVVAALAKEFAAGREVIDIDGVRVNYADGWGLLRASNTQPVLVMRFESTSPAGLARIRGEITGALARFPFVTIPSDV